jgi:hypothetical protein
VNPYLVIANFGMNNGAMYSASIFPAFLNQHVMIAIAANNQVR